MFTTANSNNLVRTWLKTADRTSPLRAIWTSLPATETLQQNPPTSTDGAPKDMFLHERIW